MILPPGLFASDGLPRPQDGSKMAQRAPRGAQESPKTAPGAPKSAPRAPKEDPKTRRGPRRGGEIYYPHFFWGDSCQIVPEGPKERPTRLPKERQEAPKIRKPFINLNKNNDVCRLALNATDEPFGRQDGSKIALESPWAWKGVPRGVGAPKLARDGSKEAP